MEIIRMERQERNGKQAKVGSSRSPTRVTPVWQLCWDGRLDEVRAALAKGRNVNSSKGNTTGLMGALSNHHNSTVRLLLEQPTVDLNGTDALGKTALHQAAESDNVEGVRLLLADSRLSSANRRDKAGNTPVMLALARNQVDSLRELVAHPSVDLDIKDKEGRSLEEKARWVLKLYIMV